MTSSLVGFGDVYKRQVEIGLALFIVDDEDDGSSSIWQVGRCSFSSWHAMLEAVLAVTKVSVTAL
eukprot:6976231-Prorocentrum_lima.AAC.1